MSESLPGNSGKVSPLTPPEFPDGERAEEVPGVGEKLGDQPDQGVDVVIDGADGGIERAVDELAAKGPVTAFIITCSVWASRPSVPEPVDDQVDQMLDLIDVGFWVSVRVLMLSARANAKRRELAPGKPVKRPFPSGTLPEAGS